MAAIVYQINKKTGVTYAYESISYWDKEKNSPGQNANALDVWIPRLKKSVHPINAYFLV